MNCHAVEESLLDYLEGQLEPAASERIRAHLDSCPACRRAHRETKELLDAMHVAKNVQERTYIRAASATPSQTTVGGGTSHSDDWKAGARLGDFEIIELVGRGGMGAVYRARQVSLNRVVALKILPSLVAASGDALSRFQREAQAAARLHHTHIVPVYAQGQEGGHFYYAMEMIEGIDLGRIIQTDPSRLYQSSASADGLERVTNRHGHSQPASSGSPAAFRAASQRDHREGSPSPFTAPPGGAGSDAASLTHSGTTRQQADYRRLARLIAQVADALAHAHRHHVLHRDIKPRNLLLGADGHLHITDFGLARLLDEPSLTISGEMLGTPAYMSPEQIDADGSHIDHRTDIYSLGVTLYELLTGVRPFDGPTREQTIARIRLREPKPPRKLNPSIPIDLETICLRAMEKDPRRRYQDARDLAADLLRYASDRPILSRRVGPFEKTIKWVRRHPGLAATMSLSLAICIGATLWTVQTYKARRDRSDALVQQAFDALVIEDYRDPARPLALLEQAAALGPDPTRFAIASGMCHLLDDTARAIELFRSALARNPTNVRVHYLLAWACRIDQRFEESSTWLARGDSLGGPDGDAFAHFFRGQALVRNNPDAAILDFKAAVSLRASFYQALLHLGRALNYQMYHDRKLENLGVVRDTLTAACLLRSDTAYPRYLLSIAFRLAAEIYQAGGDTESANRYFDQALKLAREAQTAEPTSPRGYVCEAEYWEAIGDYRNALDARDRGERFCTTAFSRVELYQYRWRVAYWLDDLDRARADLSAMATICPTNDPTYFWQIHFFPAMIMADQGKRTDAINHARQFAAIRPQDFRTTTSAACLFLVLGAPVEATDLLNARRSTIQFADVATGSRTTEWYSAVYDYLRGATDWTTLETLATKLLAVETAAPVAPDARLQWPEAHFFHACRELSAGHREAALAAFTACEATYDIEDYCYLAKVFVRKMQADANWPRWRQIGRIGSSGVNGEFAREGVDAGD
ncbi:MAG: protein kinase [Phycisphaerae bacterium]|nr:protein kinase [Phycisphaerae bacterium]